MKDWQARHFDPRRHPTMNLAVLGVAQVDADDRRAVAKARELGVTSTAACWIIRTRRGWRALYRPPAQQVLLDRTKAGTCSERRRSRQCGHAPACGYELDLLLRVPALVPPSVHPSGQMYRWVPGHSPGDIAYAELVEPPPPIVEWWALLSAPPPRTMLPQWPADSADLAAQVEAAVVARSGRPLKSAGAGGWRSGHCPFPENHRNGDRHPSFSMSDTGWKCFGSFCGQGSLSDLAQRLGVQVVSHRERMRSWEVRG